MDKNQKIRLILNAITLSVTAFLLVFSIFGWFVVNSKATANGITGVSTSDSSVDMLDTVIAKRYSLNGDITTNTYEKDFNDRLQLTKSVIYTALTDTTEEITEFDEPVYFVINEMLPGEHVDITIGYQISDNEDGTDYRIYMRNIVGDSFEVDGYDHYVTGAFRYKSISLVDENGDSVSDFTPDTDYSWFNSFKIDEDDSSTLDIVTLSHTWDKDYGYLYYTFSIYEDFTQYYRLIAQAENSYGNLLSRKNFNIGEIYLFLG